MSQIAAQKELLSFPTLPCVTHYPHKEKDIPVLVDVPVKAPMDKKPLNVLCQAALLFLIVFVMTGAIVMLGLH